LAASNDAKALKDRDSKIGELQAQVATYKSAASGGKNVDYGSLLLERDMKIAELEQDLTKQRIKSKDLEADDLKKIKGVGPKMEEKLNDFGLYTYRGVGTMGEAQKYRLSETLEGFQDRIERDEWVPQARELHYGKYNERLTDAPIAAGDDSGARWKKMAAKDKRISELEAQIAKSGSANTAASSASSKPVKGETTVSKADHDKLMKEAEAEAAIMKRRIENKEIQADDLKRIVGVGPVMEGTLNDFGIYTFKGVANLSKAQRYRVSENLGAFKDRIERDDWVGQAKVLHKEKYNEDA